MQQKYKKANEILKKNPDDKRQQEIVSQLQIESAKRINKLIYSENLWEYQKDNLSFNDIINKKVNCVGITELIYRLHKHFFNEELLAGRSYQHIFSIKQLANGEYLVLDMYVTKISDLKQWEDDEHIYSVGLHSDLYQVSILGLVSGIASSKIAEILLREAIRLDLDNSEHNWNLARLLSMQPERWEETEILYREAVDKSRETQKYKYEQTWYLTSEALFYLGEDLLDESEVFKFQAQFSDKDGTASEKAITLLEEALEMMQSKEGEKYENFLTVEEIQEKFDQLK